MFLQPEKAPVKVYLSTDKDAPSIDSNPNSVQTILKACLVTGYGEKEPAGWSLPFEDTAKGVKVLKPADSPHIPFFMRLSNVGREMIVQVYQNMTSVSDGDLKLGSGTASSYAYYGSTSGKWCVIANERSFWLFFEMRSNYHGWSLFCGDTSKNTRGERAVALIYSNAESPHTSILTQTKNKTGGFYAKSHFDGKSRLSMNALLSPALFEFDGEIYGVPIYFPSNMQAMNYEQTNRGGRRFINHAYTFGRESNVYVPIDFWEY